MGLKRYIIIRVFQGILTAFLALVVIFFIIHIVPGDPVKMYFANAPFAKYDAEREAMWRAKLGLDKPIYIQFLMWLDRLFHGDFGTSMAIGGYGGLEVTTIIRQALLNTLKLWAISFAMILAVAIPTGVISAVHQYSKKDYMVRTGTIISWSIPWFWYGIIMIYIFAETLGWFPAGGVITLDPQSARFGQGTFGDTLWHLALPAIVIGTSSFGFLTRLVRSSMLDVLRQEYITTARAKGLAERIVIYKHALRNALLPVVTVIGLQVGAILSGHAITESVFGYPGMGWLMIEAASSRDYPLLMALCTMITSVIILSIIVTDILYAYLDPRIRY